MLNARLLTVHMLIWQGNSIKELKRASRFGIFANSSTFKEVDLSVAIKDVDAIHHLNSEEISAKEYAMIALSYQRRCFCSWWLLWNYC